MPPVTRHGAKTDHENPTIAAAVKMIYPQPARTSIAETGRVVLITKWMAERRVGEEQLLSALEVLTRGHLIDDIGAGGTIGDGRAATRRLIAQAARKGRKLESRAELAIASCRSPLPTTQQAQESEEEVEQNHVRLRRKWTSSTKHLLTPTAASTAYSSSPSPNTALERQLQESAAAQYALGRWRRE
ncbi:hypothetical protein LTR85_008191 [Meristemomyces frigidus]|nr:hypothetical protein LTR85_008191 [Meristemomyces frigidus]